MLWILIPVYTRIGRATPWICYVLAVSMELYFCIRIGVHDFGEALILGREPMAANEDVIG